MPTQLSVHADEGGTYIVVGEFTDEDKAAVTPNSDVVWSLRNGADAIVNSREDVSITAASTINIVLSGNDLLIVANDMMRSVTVECTYNSSLGNNLPLKGAAFFVIDHIPGVS